MRRARHRAEAIGLPAHATVLAWRVVVPSEEMQEPVREEHGELGGEFDPARTSLASRGRNTDHEIAEEGPGAVAVLTLSLRKCKDVGWAILLAIGSVQSLDLIIVGQ